jgi:hypothetical protein
LKGCRSKRLSHEPTDSLGGCQQHQCRQNTIASALVSVLSEHSATESAGVMKARQGQGVHAMRKSQFTGISDKSDNSSDSISKAEQNLHPRSKRLHGRSCTKRPGTWCQFDKPVHNPVGQGQPGLKPPEPAHGLAVHVSKT